MPSVYSLPCRRVLPVVSSGQNAGFLVVPTKDSRVKPFKFSRYQLPDAQHRFLLPDYDGQLRSIVNDAATTISSSRVIDVLQKLAFDPVNTTWTIVDEANHSLTSVLDSFRR